MKTLINVQQNQDQMEHDFLECLRSRIIPSRFSYWGRKESHQWLRVCNSKDYQVFTKGLKLIEKSIPGIIKRIAPSVIGKKINFISLGVGNGIKDGSIIEALSQKYTVKYFPIDISLDMLEAGMKNIHPKHLETTGFVADFRDFYEITQRIRTDKTISLVSILGNTLGNFGQIEILNNIRRGMTQNDYLLVEVTMRKETGSKLHGEDLTQIIEGYNNEDFRDFVFTPLLKAGFVKSDGVVQVEYGPNQFYPKLYSVESWFEVGKDKVVKYLNQELVFKKGERILLYVSHKYTKENIEELLDGNGFEVIEFISSENKSNGLSLSRLKHL